MLLLWSTCLEPHLLELGILHPAMPRLHAQDIVLRRKVKRTLKLDLLPPSQVLAVGDSRVGYSILHVEFRRLSGYSVEALWSPNGRLQELLSCLPGSTPRKLIVGLSPSSVLREAKETKTVAVRCDWPSFRVAVDRRLNSSLHGLRYRVARPITFERYFRAPGPRASDTLYRNMLLAPPEARRAALLHTRIKALKDSGWEIVCVRFPISESLRSIEEEVLAADRLPAICERLDVLYLDYSINNYATYDGSHIDARAREAFTAELVRDLQQKAGW